MDKFFTFCKADYSKVSLDEEVMKENENVQRLLDLCKFSNAKRLNKLQTFKTMNSGYIEELLKQTIYFELKKLEDTYQKNDFRDKSLDLIIRNKAQKRLLGDESIDPIYTYKTCHSIMITFSGIANKLNLEIYNAILNKYLVTYDQFISLARKLPDMEKWKRINKHITKTNLKYVFQAHQVV